MRNALVPVAALAAACASTTPDLPLSDLPLFDADLQEPFRAAVEERGLPGGTLAVATARGLKSVAVGLADPERGDEPVTPDSRMLAGSTGKTYFAAAALALQADGEIDLDDRLTDHLKDAPWLANVPNADRVTLRQLLQHRSGIPEYVWDPAVTAQVGADPDRVWAHEELARLLEGRDALSEPGTEFSYADANYVLAMHAIERSTGRDLYEVARDRFLRPLELEDTIPSDTRDLPGLVQGHVVLGGRLGAPERMVQDDGRVGMCTQFEWAGGGYVSTSADLARWGRALWSGELIDGPYLDDLLDAPETPGGPGAAYGVATIVRETDIGVAHGHDGFFPGYLTSVAYFPDHGFAVAVQINTDDLRSLGGPLFDVMLMPAARAVVEARKTESGSVSSGDA